MNKSSIEYLTHSWNFYTGCKNQENGVCTLPCWAKAISHRFGRSFEPTFKRVAFIQNMPQGARIGVCFTGDLFGDWVNPDMLLSPYVTLKDGIMLKVECQRNNSNQFFFLTKCPWNLRKWGKFPDNAWVGVSVTNQAQHNEAISILSCIEARHKWISYEPLLNPISLHSPYALEGIDWVVIGAQTAPCKLPDPRWLSGIMTAAKQAHSKVWLKNNLKPMFAQTLSNDEIKLCQELPNAR
jgi:protein gp37